jgi:putative ABC transport system permease protein
MFELALSSVRSNISRFVATLIAIATGVAFLTAGTMLTTSIERSLGGEIDEQYAGVAAAISPRGADDEGGFQRASLPASTLDEILSVEGVRSAVGEYRGFTRILTESSEKEEPGMFGPQGPTVRNWVNNEELNPVQIIEGRAPRGANEITLDRGTVEDEKVTVGEKIEISTTQGPAKVTVVGITAFGTVDALDASGTIMAAEPWVYSLSGDGSQSYIKVLVASEEGVTDAQLRANLSTALADKPLKVMTGTAFRTEEKAQSAEILKVLRPVLTGFALLALGVCGFVIYNTFNVVVTQRTRELALVRAIAASPLQVWSSLAIEGLLIGILGSILGILLGSAITAGIGAILTALDLGLPPASIVLTPYILIRGLLAGTIVTFLAALIPALRASTTAPVDAMRSSAAESRKFPRVRSIIAATLVVLGIIAMISKSGWLVGLGALLFFLGLVLMGPAFALGFATVARAVCRPLGISARLSAENIGRNPRRTSATTNALVLGLFLVTLVTVAGQSLRTYATNTVAEFSTADFIIATAKGNLPEGTLDKVAALDGIKTVARLQQLQVRIDDHPASISAGDPKELRAVGIKTSAGSLDKLGEGIAIDATTTDAVVGDMVTFTNLEGAPITLRVTATIEPSFDSFLTGSIVSKATLAKLDPTVGDTTALVTAQPNNVKTLKAELDDTFRGYSNIFVAEGNIFGQLIGTVFDFLINAVNALLGMSVFIALIGIVNTMTLAIFERRRELGLLRAVGMTRTEMKRMIRMEAIQIAILGTVVGVLAGSLMAFLLIRATDLGEFTMPWGRLGIILLVGLVVGLVASVFPTHKISKLNVLDALAVG